MPTRRPNFIFILADDLGWGDLSCCGRPDFRTPQLDALAARGTRLSDCYAASATCSPTRIALMTGRYPARHRAGLPEPILPQFEGADVGLEPSFPALPRRLKQQGYRTALVGKWHCGAAPKFGPLQSGFDVFFGTEGTGASYFGHRDEHGAPQLFEQEAACETSGYLTHLFTDHACAFIESAARDPFYLSLHYTAPHWPWEAPGDDIGLAQERASTTNGGSLETFAAMVRAMDEGVGRVMDTVRRLGLEANTLVVFTSDNGGERYSYHFPLTGYIRLLREGGIRVPGIACWPGRIPAGRVCDQVAVTMDWTATFLALAGAAADPDFPLDGLDLMPVLAGEAACFERTLCWRTMRMDAVRRGPWKYLRDHERQRECLFNLVRDVREYNDFSASHPGVFEALKRAFSDWDAAMLPRPVPRPLSQVAGLDLQLY